MPAGQQSQGQSFYRMNHWTASSSHRKQFHEGWQEIEVRIRTLVGLHTHTHTYTHTHIHAELAHVHTHTHTHIRKEQLLRGSGSPWVPGRVRIGVVRAYVCMRVRAMQAYAGRSQRDLVIFRYYIHQAYWRPGFFNKPQVVDTKAGPSR